jgi:cation:H+ antiporter
VLPYAIAIACAVPWFLVRLLVDVHAQPAPVPPLAISVLTGLAIVGAAFLLSWAAEVFQLDVSQALALALLALIAVLPEYAVDTVFAWKAASDPEFARYAIANMTGSNRLIVGFGWASVVIVAWWRAGRRVSISAGRRGSLEPDGTLVNGSVSLASQQAVELAALAVASVYAFVIPLKGQIDLIDAIVLVAIFGVYAWATSRMPSEEPELEGPAAAVGVLPVVQRRAVIFGLFLYATVTIFLSAEYFAEGLVETGKSLGFDEFVLVQWLAPLASEAPEFLVALMFAWRGLAGAGLRTLVSSTVNQWTLLVGTLGVVYRIGQEVSSNPVAGGGLPLDPRQTEELLLTSVFSLFALAMIADFRLSVGEAALIGGAFFFQVVGAQVAPDRTVFQFVMIGAFVAATAYLLATSSARRKGIISLPARIRGALSGASG